VLDYAVFIFRANMLAMLNGRGFQFLVLLGGLGVSFAAIAFRTTYATAQTAKPAPIHTVNAATIFHDYCATCHGADAKGNGPAAPALKAEVPDLTKLSDKFGGKFPRERVRKIIEGTEHMNPHGTREMPVWGPVFHQIESDQDLGNVRVDNLVRYIESLQEK
jgi:mono/diheme cytochrome c family protein